MSGTEKIKHPAARLEAATLAARETLSELHSTHKAVLATLREIRELQETYRRDLQQDHTEHRQEAERIAERHMTGVGDAFTTLQRYLLQLDDPQTLLHMIAAVVEEPFQGMLLATHQTRRLTWDPDTGKILVKFLDDLDVGTNTGKMLADFLGRRDKGETL